MGGVAGRMRTLVAHYRAGSKLLTVCNLKKTGSVQSVAEAPKCWDDRPRRVRHRSREQSRRREKGQRRGGPLPEREGTKRALNGSTQETVAGASPPDRQVKRDVGRPGSVDGEGTVCR